MKSLAFVILSAAKDPSRGAPRSFAALRMTRGEDDTRFQDDTGRRLRLMPGEEPLRLPAGALSIAGFKIIAQNAR